jgi:hypothetical protein
MRRQRELRCLHRLDGLRRFIRVNSNAPPGVKRIARLNFSCHVARYACAHAPASVSASQGEQGGLRRARAATPSTAAHFAPSRGPTCSHGVCEMVRWPSQKRGRTLRRFGRGHRGLAVRPARVSPALGAARGLGLCPPAARGPPCAFASPVDAPLGTAGLVRSRSRIWPSVAAPRPVIFFFFGLRTAVLRSVRPRAEGSRSCATAPPPPPWPAAGLRTSKRSWTSASRS